MIIRKAVASDTKQLAVLEKMLFTVENFPLSRGSFYYHIRRNHLLVAEDGGEIRGYVLVLMRKRETKLYSLGVAKAFRGEHIASDLMQTTLAELRTKGFAKMVLEVRLDNEPAIKFYQKLGFSVLRHAAAFYRDGCDALIMEREDAEKTLSATV